jgi:hypothetical protein
MNLSYWTLDLARLIHTLAQFNEKNKIRKEWLFFRHIRSAVSNVKNHLHFLIAHLTVEKNCIVQGPWKYNITWKFIIISNLSYERSTASSKTIPPLNAI